MNGLFRIDGPLYRFGNILYYLMLTNLMWIIFSLPIVTAGASTTALFYIMGKIVRDEDVSTIKDYWRSFRNNFKQATIVWVILLIAFSIVITNIMNIGILGNMAKYMLPIQISIFIELVILTMYVFVIMSRYEMTIKNLFKAAFFMGNRHIFSTILCLVTLAAVLFLLYSFPGVFILVFISLYALAAYFIIYRVLTRYWPDKKEDELEGLEGEE